MNHSKLQHDLKVFIHYFL